MWLDHLQNAAASCPLGWLILADVAAYTARLLSDSSSEQIQRAEFHLARVGSLDLDSPGRRNKIRTQIQVLDTLVRQLRASAKIT